MRVRVRVGARGEPCAVAQGAYPVAALRGVRGSASLPERATEQISHGFPHRWLVGLYGLPTDLRIDGWLDAEMVGWTLWTLWTYGRYGRYGLYGPIGLYGVYGVYGRRDGAQLTNFLIAERMCLHVSRVFGCSFSVRGLFDGLGVFLFSRARD
jgi:hypothetical protein